MEYILEEFPSYEKLKNAADFLFKENENGDNKFYLIQAKDGKIGLVRVVQLEMLEEKESHLLLKYLRNNKIFLFA